MTRYEDLALFVFPAMPTGDRRIVLDVGELLALTDGHYRRQLALSIQLMHDAAQAEGVIPARQPRGHGHCLVLPMLRTGKD